MDMPSILEVESDFLDAQLPGVHLRVFLTDDGDELVVLLIS